MVNFKNLADKAKDAIDKRGGTESLKEDAAQLKDIAKGPGSLSDKAKAAATALKEAGAARKAETPETPGSPETPTGPPPADKGAGRHKGPKHQAGEAKAEAAEKVGEKHAHKEQPEEVGGAK